MSPSMRSYSTASDATSIVDPTPLVRSSAQGHGVFPRHSRRRRSRGTVASGLLRRAGGRGGRGTMRAAAADQIEERWAFSRPVVKVDLVYNSVLVAAAVAGLIIGKDETASVPLRLWIFAYIIQCVVHMICVWSEYKRRRQENMWVVTGGGNSGTDSPLDPSGSASNVITTSSSSLSSSSSSSLGAGMQQAVPSNLQQGEEEESCARALESANTMFAFIWWIIGFYWISAGGSDILETAPNLYWVCVIFMILDVFVVVICVVVVFLIGVALCFCLPCLIGIMALLANQDDETKDAIAQLPKFTFKSTGGDSKKQGGEGGGSEIQESSGGVMVECGHNTPTQYTLSKDDCECIICTDLYEDGCSLYRLPCAHHYHTNCIEKWLLIKPVCPLCKGSLLKNNGYQSSSEDQV